jgi:hypothetical protein
MSYIVFSLPAIGDTWTALGRPLLHFRPVFVISPKNVTRYSAEDYAPDYQRTKRGSRNGMPPMTSPASCSISASSFMAFLLRRFPQLP